MPARSATAAALLAAWLVATGCSAAHAATVELAASVANFQYQLTDLDPGDGIAPWVRFDWQPAPMAALYDDPFWTRQVAEHPDRSYAPVAITHGLNTVRGQVTRDAAMFEAALWDDSALIYMDRIASYTVSPNTGFVFTADAAVAAHAGAGWQARSSAVLEGMLVLSPETGISFGALPLEVTSGRATGTLSASARSGPLEATGALFMSARGAASGIPPVPEPDQAALLAAGALLLAHQARRRAGRRAPVARPQHRPGNAHHGIWGLFDADHPRA